MSEHPELRRALDLFPAEVAPPYGLKARVRRALGERLATANQRRARIWLCFVAFAALSLGALGGMRIAARHRDAGTSKGSVLSLRSARAILRPETELVVERDDERGASLRLVAGTVLVHVRKGTGRSFEVLAGATRVEVVGTIFGVSRQGTEAVNVEVIEGVVRVSGPSGERTLAAGARWPSGARVFDAATELTQLRGPIAVASVLPSPPVAALKPAEAEPATVPSPPASVTSANVRAPERDARAEAERAYTRAKELERSGDARAALIAYEALAARASDVSEDALFSILRVHTALGEQAAIQATITEYRARFPNGRYARDVDVHALNLAALQADDASADSECQAFLSRFPNDPRAWRFRLIQARLGARSSK